jgi:hypothetical protein
MAKREMVKVEMAKWEMAAAKWEDTEKRPNYQNTTH